MRLANSSHGKHDLDKIAVSIQLELTALDCILFHDD